MFSYSGLFCPIYPLKGGGGGLKNSVCYAQTHISKKCQAVLLTYGYPLCLRSIFSVVWTFDTLENNLVINLKFTKYLMESCVLDIDPRFSFKYFLKIATVASISPK